MWYRITRLDSEARGQRSHRKNSTILRKASKLGRGISEMLFMIGDTIRKEIIYDSAQVGAATPPFPLPPPHASARRQP